MSLSLWLVCNTGIQGWGEGEEGLEFALCKNALKAMKDSTGMLDEDKSSGPGWGGGGRRKRKLAAEERSEIQLKPQALTMKASQNSCLCWHRSP